MKANRLIRILWRSLPIGVATLASMLASASAAHAHGGMAGPDELGPPLADFGCAGIRLLLAGHVVAVSEEQAHYFRTAPDRRIGRARSNVHIRRPKVGPRETDAAV